MISMLAGLLLGKVAKSMQRRYIIGYYKGHKVKLVSKESTMQFLTIPICL